MEQINAVVSKNLKELREQRKLSLDTVSKLTGVSKSMLAQIEHGDANATITTVWKIANGIKSSFTKLVTRPERDFELITKDMVAVLEEDGGKYRNYTLFPYSDTHPFEIYYIELDPGAFLQADAHAEGTQEFITVFSGTLEVCVSNEILLAQQNCALRFKADLNHSYRNVSAEICRISMVISYPPRSA